MVVFRLHECNKYERLQITQPHQISLTQGVIIVTKGNVKRHCIQFLAKRYSLNTINKNYLVGLGFYQHKKETQEVQKNSRLTGQNC